MVDIVDSSVRVDQLDKILDNLDDIILSKNAYVRVGVETELLVDTVAAYLAKIVALVREEKVLEHLASRSVVGWVGVAQLAIDVKHSFLLRVRRVLSKSVEDDGILVGSLGILVEEYRRCARLEDFIYVVLGKLCLTLHDNLVALDRNNLAGVLVNEVLVPRLQYTCSELAANGSLHILLVDLHFLGKVEYLKDVLVLLVAHGTQKSCNWQLLLTVDIGIHHVVDVGGKLNP